MFNNIFFSDRYDKEYFWTLKEILDPENTLEPYQLNSEVVIDIVETMTGYTTPLISEGEWTNENYGKVIDLVIKRFWKHYGMSTKEDIFDYKLQKQFIAKLLSILEMTSPRYLTILQAYEDSKEELLSPVKVKVSGITRFNDTPQDEGDFANDAHTSNLTEDERTTENDLDSKMGRIREIEGNFNNVILNWSREFESLFVEDMNL